MIIPHEYKKKQVYRDTLSDRYYGKRFHYFYCWIANDISVNKKSMQTGCSLHALYYRYCFGPSTGLYFRADIAQAECRNTRGARSTWG
jgi:hypothetical protein